MLLTTVEDTQPRTQPQSAQTLWERDFDHMRAIALKVMSTLSYEAESFALPETPAEEGRARPSRAPKSPLLDALADVSAILLKCHEHDFRRKSGEVSADAPGVLDEKDIAILWRYLEERG